MDTPLLPDTIVSLDSIHSALCYGRSTMSTRTMSDLLVREHDLCARKVQYAQATEKPDPQRMVSF